MIEKIKPYVTISTENGGLDRAVNTIEVANKVNEIIEEVNRLSGIINPPLREISVTEAMEIARLSERSEEARRKRE